MSREKIHLDISLVRLTPQEITSHEPVEVVGSRGSCVDLVIDDLRLLTQVAPQSLGYMCRLLQWGSIGHVYDHLKFALVVEGEHLDLHPLERNERHRCQQQQHHTIEEDRKSTRLNSSHQIISYAVFCLKKNINKIEYV